jgi:hypothetical protein
MGHPASAVQAPPELSAGTAESSVGIDQSIQAGCGDGSRDALGSAARSALMIAETEFRNGHFTTKGEGETMWKGRLERLPEARPVGALEAAEAMFEDGCVQFPDVLSPDEVREVRAWMDAAGGPDEQYEVKGWCWNRLIGGEPHRDPMWLRLIDRDPIHDCLELVLGKGIVATSGVMWTTGRGRAMGLHTDNRTVALPEEVLADPRIRVPISFGFLQFYLDDQVEEIGPTVVVPGSWRSGRHPKDEGSWNGRMPKMVSVRAGGAVLFRPDLWHGAEMNRGDRRRYIVQVQYGRRGWRASYPPPHYAERYAPEVLERATPRQRELLGGDRP